MGICNRGMGSYLSGECALKPPVDWSPCQQKGEEHNWFKAIWAFNWNVWRCIKCGIVIEDLDKYAGVGELGESS